MIQQVSKDGDSLLAMVDPCNLPGNAGWPLRNALLLAAVRWRIASLRVVCLRQQGGRYSAQRSLLATFALPDVPEGTFPSAGIDPATVQNQPHV